MQGGPIKWNGIHVYPGEDWNRTVYQWAAHHGNGDPVTVITLFDVWPLDIQTFRAIEQQGRLACWVPVDHDPAPPAVVNFLRESGAVPIAMSRFGETKLREAGLDPLYVPHGVDTEMFAPSEQPELARFRELLEVPLDAFVVGIVANNQGQSPARKAFSESLMAFSIFQQSHPEAILHLHTEMTGFRNGLNLYRMLERFEVPPESIRLTEQVRLEHVYPPAAMAGLYNLFDVLLNPSYGEGFGIPIIEAQACFPAETHVEAEDVLATFCKSYTGDLVKIETAAGSFEATSDHPIWTADGWQPAGAVQPGTLLLSCDGTTEDTHAGPIGGVVDALSADIVGSGRGADGSDSRIGLLAPSLEWPDAQIVRHAADKTSSLSDRGAAQLLRRVGGWGGDSDDPQGESWAPSQFELSTMRSYREHGQEADGLADVYVSAAAACGLTLDPWQKHVLSVLARGTRLPSVLQGIAAAAGLEGRPVGMGNRVDGGTALAIKDGPLDTASVGDHLADPRSQYEAVTSVSRRRVENLPVYNVTTAAGTYRVGNGYLVHNCGTPVIVSDWTAMPELCGAGWKVGGVPWDHAMAEAYWLKPDVDQIVAALESAFEARGDEVLRAQARRFAKDYDVEHVMSEFWVPALERIHAPREVQPIGPNRKTRRAMKKERVEV